MIEPVEKGGGYETGADLLAAIAHSQPAGPAIPSQRNQRGNASA